MPEPSVRALVDRSLARTAALAVALSILTGCLVAAGTSGPAGGDSTGAGSGGGTVSVGAGSGSGSPGSGGSSSGAGPGGGSGGGSPWTCTYTDLTLNNEGGFPAGGPLPGAWYSVFCVDVSTGVQVTQTVWITGSQPAPTPSVDPRVLALQAENSMELPHPVVDTDPSGTSVVQLATWFWIDPSLWRTISVTATAGPVSATAVATPVDVRWSTGDGSGMVCYGPGTPYRAGLASTAPSSSCCHTYVRTSAGQPSLDGDPDDATFVVTASVDWAVSWTSSGVSGGGALPSLVTATSALLRVDQIESVNTAPGVWASPLSSMVGAGS